MSSLSDVMGRARGESIETWTTGQLLFGSSKLINGNLQIGLVYEYDLSIRDRGL